MAEKVTIGNCELEINMLLQTIETLTAERDAEFEYRKKVERERLHHSSEREALARQLAAALAREAKLRDAAKAVLEVGMGSDFEALNAAFAIPADDSTLMERLKQERDRCALLLDNASGKGSIISCVSAAAAIRSMT